MAVGGSSFNGGPIPTLDNSGMGYLPMPAMAGGMTPLGLPNGPGLTPNPALSAYGGGPSSSFMEEGGGNFMGHTSGEYSYPNQFGLLAVEGGSGQPSGRRSTEPGAENSDEYWNALIDGILGTTGGMSHGNQGNN
ncbi:hypothetical protein C369_07415 [Cryptococcus neoformans A5-35-17]|nr:hypothetical protein C369_07415 [Cryptococcus neoformans var. grubii A5-35-17]